MNYSLLQDAFVFGTMMASTAGFANSYWPYSAGYAVTLVDNSARLEYEVISLDSRLISIPRVVSYPYSIPQYFQTPLVAFANPVSSGNVQTTGLVQSQSLRLSYMPSLIYIYAHLPVQTRAGAATAGQPGWADCNYALGTASGNPPAAGGMIYNTDQVGTVSINLNNRQNLLAGASIRDLYRIAVSNGYQYSWTEWVYNPVVIVSPTKDLGLDLSQSDIYPDQNGNVTLQIQASFCNWNYLAQTATIYAAGQAALGWAVQTAVELMVVCVQEGVIEISPDAVVINTGCISAVEAKQALEAAARGEEDSYVPSLATKTMVEGAGLSDMFGNVKNVISSVAKGIGSVTSDPTFKAVLEKAKQLSGGSVSAAGLHRKHRK
jgi:hypothetical protein